MSLLVPVLLTLGVIWWLIDLFRHPKVCPWCDGVGERGPGGGKPVPGKRVVPCRRCHGSKRTSRITGRAWKG